MASATVQVQINTAAGPTVGSAEGGIRFNLEDSVAGTTNPITIPTSAGTNYSWYKTLMLTVTGTGTTNMANRGVRLASAITTGLHVYFKDGGTTYTQASGANKPVDNATTNDAVPGTYTEVTTSHQVWNAGAALTNSAARNGNFVILAFGVANTFLGGGGDTALPNLTFQYDEY